MVFVGAFLFKDKIGELFVEKQQVQVNQELAAKYKQQLELRKQKEQTKEEEIKSLNQEIYEKEEKLFTNDFDLKIKDRRNLEKK